MRKESSFAVNRAILLTIVAVSVIVPLVHLPQLMQTPMKVELIPDFSGNEIRIQNLPVTENSETFLVRPYENGATPAINELTIPLETLLKYFYLAGVLIAFVLLVRNIVLILLIFRKAAVRQMDSYRLLVVDREIPGFAFGRSVVISQSDYDSYGPAILAHEQAHIRLNHFYDLVLLELVKILHWFNPAIYGLISDLKEMHEFQADQYTLTSGIDATQYQLLIIQKGVGPKRFALANSFNHCQIKKRIVMMNKQKTSKAWRWKVAAFLPLLALLLMAFGKKGEEIPPEQVNVPEKMISVPEIDQENQNQQSSRLIEIRKDGNYIDGKQVSLEEIIKKGKEWGAASNKWIHLQIDQSIPYNRIDEIRLGLEAAKVYHVTQSTVNSDEIIYPAGDVSALAKFTQGSWNEWMTSQKKKHSGVNFNEGEYQIHFSFIIGKDGKVRDGHIVKSTASPGINAAYEIILAQIPDWIPAKRLGEAVSVLAHYSDGVTVVNVKTKVESK